MTFPSRLCIFVLLCSLLAILVFSRAAVAQAPSGDIVLDDTGTLMIEEGETGEFNVSLSQDPNADVTITLASDNDDVSVSPTSLTFTADNSDVLQTVTVTAGHDDGADDETAKITLSATGGITASDVEKSINVNDDDRAELLLSARALTILEGGSGHFEVRPATRPTADIEVTITVPSSSTGISVDTDPSTPGNQNTPLIFNRDGQDDAWDTYRRVMVFVALDDHNPVDDSVELALSAAAEDAGETSDYDDKSASVSISVRMRPRGNLIVDPAHTLALVEGDSKTLAVSLDTEPNEKAVVDLDHSFDSSHLVLSPRSLTFTPENYEEPQMVTVTPRQNRDDADRNGTITLEAVSGIKVPMSTLSVTIENAPPRGRILLSETGRLMIDEGRLEVLTVKLDTQPTANVDVTLKSDHLDLTVLPVVLTFTESNYATARTVVVISEQDSDQVDEDITVTLVATGGIRAPDAVIEVSVQDNDETSPDWPVKTQALALPAADAQDDAIMRLHCKESADCAVHIECAAQSDGSILEGSIPSIPANGALTLTASDIEGYIGESWSNKGRLGCALHSEQAISAQVWTRSGDAVLVNNSAFIRSFREGEMYRADIESIPSPDGMEESNIRIRCTSAFTAARCTVALACYDDAGRRYDGDLGAIERLRVRHLQRDELSRLIDHRWSGLGLSCEIRSDQIFTVQVMTRTGGGGALVNNSATGGRGSAGN